MKFKTFTEEMAMASNEPELSDQTKAEQEYGRKLAAQNAANFEKAQKMREAETTAKEELTNGEAQAAVDEALQHQPDKNKPQKGDRK